MQEWAKDGRFKMLSLLLLGLLSLGVMAYIYLAYAQAQYAGVQRTASVISVAGKSELFVRPDIATFTFSVTGDEKDATKAQEKAAQAGNDIKAYLKEQGISEKDIKTENYSLRPKKEYEAQTCSTGWCPPGKEILVGYIVEETISVKVRKVDEAGQLLGGVGGKGATNISDLSFTIDDTDTVKDQVRAEAIADGKAKAEVLAKSLGVRLGNLQSYYENGDMPPVPMMAYDSAKMVSSEQAGSAPQVAPGENKVVSNVTLVYEIH